MDSKAKRRRVVSRLSKVRETETKRKKKEEEEKLLAQRSMVEGSTIYVPSKDKVRIGDSPVNKIDALDNVPCQLDDVSSEDTTT